MLYLMYNKYNERVSIMFIVIEQNSPVPIYTQLINQIKKAIVTGELEKGEMLPSVRTLAGDLGVNMHTVNKAYNLLTEEGILVKSQRGYTIELASEQPLDFEQDMLRRMEELLVDLFIHDIPTEQAKEWMQSTANTLKKEW